MTDYSDPTSLPATQWTSIDNTFVVSPPTVATLPAGVYRCGDDGWGRAMLTRFELSLDELVMFPDHVFGNTLKRIDTFWQQSTAFKEMGYLHRTGLLFYGPAGCGKSSLLYQVMASSVAAGHLCLICPARVMFFTNCVDAIRKIEPDRPLLCIIEDIDAHLAGNEEQLLLQWLDGTSKADHVVTLATTNYPEQLDKRIVCRPRRFDRRIYIGFPDDAIRTTYLRHKLKNTKYLEELPFWVSATRGLSLASLAELILSVTCMGDSLLETAKLLQTLESTKPDSEDMLLMDDSFEAPVPAKTGAKSKKAVTTH